MAEAPTEPEAIPADVDPAGRPLNEAGWALTNALPDPVPGHIFNAIKPALRVAIQRYLAEVAALDRASRTPVDGAEAKTVAWLSATGLLTLDPDQADAWARYGTKVTPLYTRPAPARRREMKQVSVRLSLEELLMVRHAITIGSEDGSLIAQLDTGDPDPEYEERADRINRKIKNALAKIGSNQS